MNGSNSASSERQTRFREKFSFREKFLFREKMDWLLAVAIGGLLPLVLLYCLDFWFRTGLRFFPILILASIALVARNGRIQTHAGKRRSIWTIVVLSAAGIVAIASAIFFSPWLAVWALMLAGIGWMLERFGGNAWFEIVGWTMPLWAMLVLPLSDASDATQDLERAVAYSSSSLLDIVGIPQLAVNDALELRSGRLSISSICRGLGSPYLLLSLVVLLCMLTQGSFAVGAITVASVPLWAWFGSVLHVVLGVILLQNYDMYLFIGYRQWIAQGLVLIASLLSIWLFQTAVQNLLSPFIAESAGVGGLHKFFNRAVLWPAKDPLRKRRSLDSSDGSRDVGNILGHRNAEIGLAVVACTLVAVGGYSLYQVGRGNVLSQIWLHRVDAAEVQRDWNEELLPPDFHGMTRAAFEITPFRENTSPKAYTIRWTYLLGAKRVEIAVMLPYRGCYPAELDHLTKESRLVGSRLAFETPMDDAESHWLHEVVTADPVFGRSYLCYTCFTSNGSELAEPSEPDTGGLLQELATSLTLQPTTASVRLFIEGSEGLTDEEREDFRTILTGACQRFRHASETGSE